MTEELSGTWPSSVYFKHSTQMTTSFNCFEAPAF